MSAVCAGKMVVSIRAIRVNAAVPVERDGMIKDGKVGGCTLLRQGYGGQVRVSPRLPPTPKLRRDGMARQAELFFEKLVASDK